MLDGSRILGGGRFARLLVTENGWEYAERLNATGIVVIVALAPGNRIVLTEQFRPPVDRHVIELPAGLVGDTDENESLVEAARRELFEETGYEAENWTYLTEGPPSAGFSSEHVTLYLATDLDRTGDGGGDHTEDIRTHAVDLAEADEWLDKRRRDGLSIDPKVYSGLYFAARAISR